MGTLQGNENLASPSCSPCSLLRPPWLTLSAPRGQRAVGEEHAGIFQGSEEVQSLEGHGGRVTLAVCFSAAQSHGHCPLFQSLWLGFGVVGKV